MLAASLLLLAVPAMAASIQGTVTNLTNNKPSAGDTVSLIRLQQGMQVAAEAKTDAHGHYTLSVTDADPMHLVRVTHQGANYFQPAPPGRETVNVDVYDAAEKVEGISTEADVLRIEADGSSLRVTENYFVKNVSSPPKTQFSSHSYPIYLPKDATIHSSAALGPGSMPVQSSPMPYGELGGYAFVFPLRPGETRFQVAYTIPYSGRYSFVPRFAAPVDNFALILPKSIHFTGAPAYQSINDDVNVQTFLVKNAKPGMKLNFQVSGTGTLPQQTPATQQGTSNAGAEGAAQNPEAAAQQAAQNNTRPGIGLGVPIDTPDPLHKYKWWIISAAVILLAVGAGISMKQPAPAANPVEIAAGKIAGNVNTYATPTAKLDGGGETHSTVLLQALKDELFSLESERLQGTLGPEEYERQKAALETVLKRALERRQTPPSISA